jgi:hypothetical protein
MIQGIAVICFAHTFLLRIFLYGYIFYKWLISCMDWKNLFFLLMGITLIFRNYAKE